jgi:Flp pilus assembly protein TadG
MRYRHSRVQGAGRPGKTLVMFALLLPVLLGMIGLALDGGLLLATYRQTQNAADAAALAAAVDLSKGASNGTAQTVGQNYVTSYNNVTGATVRVNIPPSTGSKYAGNPNYAEAIVSYPYSTSFIQLLGVPRSQTVTARSVAGHEPTSGNPGVITLTQATPRGILISGGTLSINGTISDDSTNSSTALDVLGSAKVYASQVLVSGGVTGSANVQNYPSGGGTGGLQHNTGINYADPLVNLPTPTTANGVVNAYWDRNGVSQASAQNLSITSGTATLKPGIYQSITIGGTANVTFQPGIYVISGGLSGTGLSISGGTVTGSGIMFYNTGNNYNATNGTTGTTYGSISISADPNVSFTDITSLNTSSSIFDGIAFFQDRNNSQIVSFAGGTTGSKITGTTYAPAAQLTISGSGTWQSQLIVGNLLVSGSPTLTINPTGAVLGQAGNVYLVE